MAGKGRFPNANPWWANRLTLTKKTLTGARIDTAASEYFFGIAVVTNTLDLTADGYMATTERDLTADGVVAATTSCDLLADGVVVETRTLDLTGDGFVGTFVLDLLADGLVSAAHTLDLTADGIVRETHSLDLTADGYVTNLFSVAQELTADGIVKVETRLDLVADGFVSIDVIGGRYVAISNGFWDDLSIWRYADAERSDGTSLVAPDYARPLTVLPSIDYLTSGVALPIPTMGSIDKGGTLTVTLVTAGGTTLATTTLAAGSRTASAGVDWYYLPWTAPVALTAGETYYVRTSGNNLQIVATFGSDSLYYLNGLIVTDVQPSVWEARSVLIAPGSTGAVRGTRTVTMRTQESLSCKTVQVAPGSTLALQAGSNVALRVQKVLQIGAGATLISAPNVTKTHEILFTSDGGGLNLYGSLTMTGQTKSRIATLASGVLGSDTELTLTEAMSGWVIGDRIAIGTTNDAISSTVLLASDGSDANPTLASTVGRVFTTGGRVVNLSRSCRIWGLSQAAPSGFKAAAGASLSLSHVELRYFGPSAQLAPDNACTATLDDVVFQDGSDLMTTGGAAGLVVGTLTTVNEITVFRCRSGVLFSGIKDHTGDLIVVDNNLPHAAVVVQGQTTADVVGIGINGCAVGLMGGARFTGNVENQFAYGERAGLVACVAGDVASIRLTGGHYSPLAEQGAGAILLQGSTFLGELVAENVISTGYLVHLAAGARGLGNGIVRTADVTGPALVRLAGTGFIDLVDEDGVTPTMLVSGTLLRGSRVARRDRTQTAYGVYGRSATQVYSGSASMELIPVTGETLVVELARIAVASGENVRIEIVCYGTLTLELVNPDITVGGSTIVTSPGAWSTQEVSAVSSAAGVMILRARATTTCYLDEARRI